MTMHAIAEIAVVDPVPTLNAHESGMGVGAVVVNPADAMHGALACDADNVSGGVPVVPRCP